MKKILAILFCIFMFSGNVFAFEEIFVEEKPPMVTSQEPEIAQKQYTEVKFDWFDITDSEKSGRIEEYKNIIFGNDSKINLTKDEFRTQLAKYKKDKDFKHHYMLANNGVTQDEDARYNPLYYNPYGRLYYVDITSDQYPDYPYYSVQYDRKGNLKSAIYFVSKDIQYMFNEKQEFIGIWYKDKMYNCDGKQISTREGW